MTKYLNLLDWNRVLAPQFLSSFQQMFDLLSFFLLTLDSWLIQLVLWRCHTICISLETTTTTNLFTSFSYVLFSVTTMSLCSTMLMAYRHCSMIFWCIVSNWLSASWCITLLFLCIIWTFSVLSLFPTYFWVESFVLYHMFLITELEVAYSICCELLLMLFES